MRRGRTDEDVIKIWELLYIVQTAMPESNGSCGCGAENRKQCANINSISANRWWNIIIWSRLLKEVFVLFWVGGWVEQRNHDGKHGGMGGWKGFEVDMNCDKIQGRVIRCPPAMFFAHLGQTGWLWWPCEFKSWASAGGAWKWFTAKNIYSFD